MCVQNGYIKTIKNFFEDNPEKFFKCIIKTESNLLKCLDFENSLKLSKDKKSDEAFFGWGSLKSDFRRKEDNNTIIEVKYIRSLISKNECDIKNALSQIIEQAVCKNVSNAILVIIDSGRASDREWNYKEIKFLSMFKNNPFNIELDIVRVRIDKKNQSVICDTL